MIRRHSLIVTLLLCIAVLVSACAQPLPTPAPAAPAAPAAQPPAAAPAQGPVQAPAPAAAQPAASQPTTAPAAQPAAAAAKPADQKKVELIFRQADPPGEVEGLIKAIDAWNVKNPNIHVTLETVPFKDGQAQYVREAQAGGGPDVLQMAFIWTADLGKNKLVADLTPLIKESAPGKGVDDFVGTDLGTVDGKIYGLPWTIDTATMVYRPDLLQAGGVTKFPDTWTELADVAKKLTRDTNGDGRPDQYGFCWPAGGAPDGATWFLVNAYIWSNGKSLMKQGSDGKWAVGVSAEDMAEAMNYFNGYFVAKSTPESMIAISWEGDPEMVGSLNRGDCAISNFRIGTFVQAAAQAKNPLAMALEPKGNVERASQMGGRALGINANTKNPKEAWTFMRYLLSADTFATYTQYPAQKSLLNEKQKTLPELEKPYAEQLQYGKTYRDYIFSGANVNSMWAVTNKEFSAVFAKQKTSAQASADLVKAYSDLLAGNK
jgi:multiple sugar transport system substrate-binding protein